MYARVLDPAGSVRAVTYAGETVETGDVVHHTDDITWLPPCEPTKIICLARNVRAHADERDAEVPDRPSYFLKPPSALATHDSTVTLSSAIAPVEYEAELAAVIGEQCREVDRSRAFDVVAGLTCLNDLSNRADQRRELNWVRGKAFDNAAPIGPVLVDPSAVPADASITLAVNGSIEQRGRRDDYEFDLATVIADVTRYLTLEPGDVIAMGTTAGVGELADGDSVTIDIEGIPPLRHSVRYQSPA